MKTINLPSIPEIEAAIDIPFDDWAHQCHAISYAILTSGVLDLPDGGRIARGVCNGVGSQHSWIVVGMDCYADDVTIIDPTLWSYRDDVEGIYVGTATTYGHTPHGGTGSIWTYGQPVHGGGETITIDPALLTAESQRFLAIIGPLDRAGWSTLIHAPVHGWPAANIIEAAYQTPALKAVIPVDIVGMLTDANPGGAYL